MWLCINRFGLMRSIISDTFLAFNVLLNRDREKLRFVCSTLLHVRSSSILVLGMGMMDRGRYKEKRRKDTVRMKKIREARGRINARKGWVSSHYFAKRQERKGRTEKVPRVASVPYYCLTW